MGAPSASPPGASEDPVDVLREDLKDFLERLGRSVESTEDGLVARHRTALLEEERQFRILDGRIKPRADAINITLPGHPAPRDLGCEAYSFDGFLDRTVQADRLADSVLSNEQIRAALEFFIPQHVASAGKVLRESSLQYTIATWLPSPTSHLLVVLAPAGYGKTVLTYQVAQRLAATHRSSKAAVKPPFPMLIPFGEFRRIATFENMVISALQRQNVTDYTANAFAFLVGRRRAVLILDGFDELLEERPEEAQRNLRELIATLDGEGKVIVTARSTFFRTSDDVARFLAYDLTPDRVATIELQPFDKGQRHDLVARVVDTQREVRRITTFIDHPNVQEVMSSPFLLRETVEALRQGKGDIPFDRRAGRLDIFSELEASVYARERLRHNHDFRDETQRGFMLRLAKETLRANVRGFEWDLVRVVASEAAEDAGQFDEADLAQLADHHFVTVSGDSQDVHFTHQIFREYFQARAILKASRDGQAWLPGMLAQRPLPEGVGSFLAELDDENHVPKGLVDAACDGTIATERLVSNVGLLCAAYGSDGADLLQDLVQRHPHALQTGFTLTGLALADSTCWRGQAFDRLEFLDCDLTNADFTGAAIGDLVLGTTAILGARFEEINVGSLTIDFGLRVFGHARILEELSTHGGVCGLEAEGEAASVDETIREWVVELIRGRLWRFYVPGKEGLEGSRWDAAIQEKNLFGGVARPTATTSPETSSRPW